MCEWARAHTHACARNFTIENTLHLAFPFAFFFLCMMSTWLVLSGGLSLILQDLYGVKREQLSASLSSDFHTSALEHTHTHRPMHTLTHTQWANVIFRNLRGWRDGSEVESMYCSCRRPAFGSYIGWLTHQLPAQGNPLPAFMDIAHMCISTKAHTYIHIN